MTIDEKIFACLSAADSATYALIAARTYNGQANQGEQKLGDYVVFQEVYSDPAETHGNTGDTEDSLDGTLYQFSCYGVNWLRAKALRQAVRFDLLKSGAMPDVKACNPISRSGEEPEIVLKRADLDITLFHNPITA